MTDPEFPVTVWYQGGGLMIHRQIAKQFSLYNGYQIKSEAEFWRILDASATFMLGQLEEQLNQEKGKLELLKKEEAASGLDMARAFALNQQIREVQERIEAVEGTIQRTEGQFCS